MELHIANKNLTELPVLYESLQTLYYYNNKLTELNCNLFNF